MTRWRAAFAPALSRVPMLLAGLALLLQAFVVQTHIHGWRQAPLEIESVFADLGAGTRLADEHSAPHQREHTPCAICQALANSSGLLANIAEAANLSLLHALQRWFARAAPPLHRTAFFWRSRAPPL